MAWHIYNESKGEEVREKSPALDDAPPHCWKPNEHSDFF